MKTRAIALFVAATCIAAQAFAQAESGALSAARELYASARYDEALALLDGLRPADAASVSDRRAIQQYRSLCLLALGRAAEAEEAIAAVVTAEPLYQPSEADASPRVRAAFTEVRQRLLPGIALSQYSAAKALYDRKDYSAAGEAFRQVLRLLDDPDMTGRHGDLRVLASGFLDLSVAAVAPASERNEEGARSSSTAAVPAPDANRIYTAEDADVSPPVAIKQALPLVPASITPQIRNGGLVEIVIDELGRAAMVTIRSSVHPMYDKLLLSAARDWRYTPATAAGTPVKYRKLIQIALAR